VHNAGAIGQFHLEGIDRNGVARLLIGTGTVGTVERLGSGCYSWTARTGRWLVRLCCHANSALAFERFRNLANNKSSKKRILINETKRLRNRPYISLARTRVKQAELAIKAGDQSAATEAVGEALSTLDRVAGKGIIHRNNAARRKSRLMKKYNILVAA